MRHRIWIGVLVLGVVLGFGSGIAHVIHGHGGCRFHDGFHESRRRAFMHEVSEECVRAAREEDHRSHAGDDVPWDRRGPHGPGSFSPPPPPTPAAPTVIFVPMPVPAGTVQTVQVPPNAPPPPAPPST